MPLSHSYTDKIFTHLIWEINEDEKFFLSKLSLTYREIDIIKSKKTSIKKIEFLSVRYLLRLLKINPNDLTYSKDGAPQLKTGNNISISHCKGYSTVLISEKKCGIDIETYRNNILNIKDKFINDKDVKQIDSSSVNDLILIWCLKESVYKAEKIPGLNFKNEIFVESINKEEKNAKTVVKKFNYDKSYTCNLLFDPNYICTIVFSND
jgi:phosphopantetheinyl transferase